MHCCALHASLLCLPKGQLFVFFIYLRLINLYGVHSRKTDADYYYKYDQIEDNSHAVREDRGDNHENGTEYGYYRNNRSDVVISDFLDQHEEERYVHRIDRDDRKF